MGWNITVGRRIQVPYDGEDGETYYLEDAEGAEHPDAPYPPGDEGTGKSNNRCPSYGAWEEFAQRVKLYPMFFGVNPYREGGLFRSGVCTRLTRKHLAEVEAARIRWMETHPKPPGYADDGSLDPHRMRLDWLVFWMTWALDTWGDEAVVST